MKIQSINRNQNFKGFATDFLMNNQNFVTGLAGSSVISQKVVMSGAEATIGPCMDVAIGKGITKIANEKDGKTNQSSKAQAIRTTSQAVGGTIVGVIIRGACIAAATALFSKVGEKAGGKIAQIINPENISKTNLYEYSEKMSAWGKTVGGAVAIGIMLFTNFIIDAPFINWINKTITNAINPKKENEQAKEVK